MTIPHGVARPGLPNMGTYRQTLLYDLSTPVAFLCREARVDSDHLVPGTLSLGTQESEKRAPTSVHDALCKVIIFHHIADRKVFNHDMMIALCRG